MNGAPQDEHAPDFIRRAADDELTADEAAMIARADSMSEDHGVQSSIQFEHELRMAVGRVMGAEGAPDGLADRIRSAMAAAPDSDSIHLDDARDGLIETAAPATATNGSAGVELPPITQTNRRSILGWLESPRRANAAAVAAVLALVIGAIGFGIVMPSISQWGQAPPARFVETAATFAANEHGRCTGVPVLEGKIDEFTDVAAARAFLAGHLDRPESAIAIPDLSENDYEFVGVASCHVPGRLPSAHAVWRSRTANADGGYPMVSAFVTLDRDQFDFRDADAADVRVGGVTLGDGSQCSRTVRVVKRGGLVVLVVCCDETVLDDATMVMARSLGG